jgi:hypothetical protein
MNTLSTAFKVLTCIVFTLAITSLAQAQATRTWVSGVGDDVNPCSRTAPCKTFAGAISKTARNGEINAIDSAGFGTLTITKSITVDGTGVHASALNSLVNGFVINITDPADVNKAVVLRNISINGVGNGSDGIRVLSANDVTIEGVFITGQSGDGIEINNAINNSHTYIKNVNVNDVNGHGLNVTNLNTALRTFVSIKGSRFTDIGDTSADAGIFAGPTSRMTVVDTEISGCVGFAFDAGNPSENYLESVTIANNTTGGIRANTGSTTRISNVDIFQNDGPSLSLNGGTVQSFLNNRQVNNVPDNAPNATKNPQ